MVLLSRLTADDNEEQNNDLEDRETLAKIPQFIEAWHKGRVVTFMTSIPKRGVSPCRSVTKKMTEDERG